MKKVLIATFSQTGSTKKIADQLAKGLNASEFEVTHFKISKNHSPDPDEYDIIGIGTPVYFFRPPFIVQDFIRKIKNLKNKSSFVFITYGTHLGNCGNWIRRKLKKKGSTDLGYFKSFGADYWLGYIKRGVMFSPDSPTEKEFSSATEFGKNIAERYANKNPDVEPFDPTTPFIYQFERMLVARPSVKYMYSKTFKADSNCDLCGICIAKCPVHNITETKNGKLKWGSECLLCGTCELSCPKDAITSILDSMIFAPTMIQNIKLSKKKQIPWAKVEHSGGETRLV